MVFRRREKLTLWQWVVEGFWPRAGWRRVIEYFRHRIRRLPDTPHKVARGMFAGTFVAILPIPGFQMIAGGLLAWAMRGNILAAVLCSFISNPITTPPLALASIGIGHWLLGIEEPLTWRLIGHRFARAGDDLWYNFKAMFNDNVTRWDGLAEFWREIYLPYFVGAVVIGLILGLIAHWLTVPLVRAYQNARAARFAESRERRRRLREALTGAAHRLTHPRDGGGSERGGNEGGGSDRGAPGA